VVILKGLGEFFPEARSLFLTRMLNMKLTKKEQEQEVLSLQGFGLLPDEIEAYFEFFDEVEIEIDEKKTKRVRVLNSGRNKNAGKSK
jgi:hypothetical protein